MRKVEVQKMTSVPTKFGGGESHVITPKNWLIKKIWLLIEEEYIDLMKRAKKYDN